VGIRGRSGAYVDSIRGLCAAVDQVIMTRNMVATEQRGGSGGSRDYEFRCPSGHALVGLHGRAGSLIDSIGIRCARLTRNGMVERGSRPDGVPGSVLAQTCGGGGGRAFSLTCPQNHSAPTLTGSAGMYLDRIQLGCHPAGVRPITASLFRCTQSSFSATGPAA
jgi:hypothetical protein